MSEGPTHLTLPQEIDANGKAQNLLLGPGQLLLVLVDVGAVPLPWLELGVLLMYSCNWASLYIRYVTCPALQRINR
jgi:hypothetical protein